VQTQHFISPFVSSDLSLLLYCLLCILSIYSQTRTDSAGLHREWYCLQSQWVSDFGAHAPEGGQEAAGESVQMAGGGAEGSSGGGGTLGSSSIPGALAEEMIVPADEHFTRCPVSNEAFIPEWDDEEGDYMYKNAVKVLVTATSDESLFDRCQPTAHEGLRYAIVHQLLVMDGWLASGKAITVQEAIRRLKGGSEGGGQEGQQVERALLSALGEEDDEEDVFLVLDAGGRIGADLLQCSSTNTSGGGGQEAVDQQVDSKEENVSV
jgi:hypothetical protein